MASNTTDRSSGPHKNWHGEVTTSCRTLIEDLIRLDVDEEEDEPTSPPDKVKLGLSIPSLKSGFPYRSAHQGEGARVPVGALECQRASSNLSCGRQRLVVGVSMRYTKRRWRSVRLMLSTSERKLNGRSGRTSWGSGSGGCRYKARREERFQRLLKSLYARSKLKDDVTNLLQTHSNIEEEK